MATPFTLADKQIEIPSAWHELTVEHFVKIRALENITDAFSLLSVLTGTSDKQWKELDLDEFNYSQLMAAVEWIWKEPTPKFAELPMPDVLPFGDKFLVIPKDLNLKTFQQRYDFEQAVFPCIEKTGDIVDVLPKLIAIYLQPLYTGEKYNGDDLDPFIAMANGIKALDAYPVGSFFLKQFLGLIKPKPQALKESVAVIQMKNEMPESKSLKSLA